MNNEVSEKTDISDMVEVKSPGAISPMTSAVELLKAGLSTEQLRDMMSLQLQWEANEARKAFTIAMTAFKKNPPEIVKKKMVDFASRGGGNRTTYMHATLGDVCAAVIEALATQGFSHRWTNRFAKDEGIYVTCILTHSKGHSESFEMGPGKPDDSGGKNAIQAVASTQTYFQRYSLLGVTGLTTNDMKDNDGNGGQDGFRLEEWIEQAEKAADLPTLADVKQRGFAAIKKINDTQAYTEFREVVNQRRAALDPEYAKRLAEKDKEPGSEG